jgi:hypothetical protein
MTLRRGVLLGACVLAGLAALPARSAPVPVHVRVAGASGAPVVAEVQVAGGPSGKEQKTTILSAGVAGVVQLDLPEQGVWYVQALVPGFWGETRAVVTPHTGEPVELRLWPSTTLRAEVAAPARLSGVSVRFQPVADEAEEPVPDAFPEGTNDCRLDGRTVECVIPAGRADYSLRSPGHVTVYRWNQTHAAGETVNLGRVEFRKGSSLVGRVTIAQGAALEKGSRVRVTLDPDRAGASSPDEEKRVRIAGAAVFPNSRGIFVFEGVKPGGYQLSASAPGLVSETRQVTILDALEAELREPIVLAAPVTLDAGIEPATDPWGGAWTVDLLRIDARKRQSVLVASSSPDAGGRWRRSGLPPGDYALNVRRQPQGAWHSRMLALAGDVHLDVKIPLVRVAGALKLGGAPLAGSMWFGGERGAVSVPITTNGEGEFRGILPAVDGGIWTQVDVTAEHPTVRRSLRDVRISEPDPDGISRLDIELPSSKVFGEVTTERGAPVSSATVFLSVPGETGELLQTHADEAGQFSFNGLEAATYSLRAIGRAGKSEAFDVVVDGQTQEYVTLVLKESGGLRGLVSSRYGSVAGARVSAYPDDRSGFDLVEWAMTDPDGRFHVVVPPAARHASVTVAAPGFAFQFFRTTVDPRRPVPIQLEQDGGRLRISFHGPDFPFVFHAGGFLALQDLVGDGIAVLDGPIATAENLQAGQYEVCVATPSEALAFAQSVRPKERCTGGFLPPGGQLALDAGGTAEGPPTGGHGPQR